jgi:hypothetical protein
MPRFSAAVSRLAPRPWFRQAVALGLLLGLHGGAMSATLYLCKSYGGGLFWSGGHCRDRQALIERIASVPDGLPFQQQVELAEQGRAEAQRLTAPPPPNFGTTTTTTQIITPGQRPASVECPALAQEILQYEQMARQPQSGQMQDWLTSRKRAARDRQFQLRC